MKRFFAFTIVCSLTLALLPGYAAASAAVPVAATAEAPQTVTLDTSEPAPSVTSGESSELYQEYTIKHGDCLYSIGRRFGVSWRKIAALNGIQGPEYTIITGHTLKIPARPKLPGTTGNYLILCETEAQKECLAEFEAFKTWSGFTVTIKSVEADVKPAAGTDASEAIRQYLKKTDQELSLEYVLLIGKPYIAESLCPQHTGGVIPMRYLYFNSANHNTRDNCVWSDYSGSGKDGFNTPTDIYYAFDFNWDYDGDGFPGETEEIAESVKEANPEPLFMLGRIPFSDTKDIGTVLNTTMQYELSQKAHSDALIGSFGVWAYYADALAKNLKSENIEATTMFDSEGDESFSRSYKGMVPYSKDNFNKEVSKKYDFLYTMDDFERSYFGTAPDQGTLAGIYFIDAFASLKLEPGGSDTRLTAQDMLAQGSASAVIATVREIGFNPKDPAPLMPSLLFTNKTLCVSREFYAAIQSMIMENNVPSAYLYCYLGDPSITLMP